MTNEEIKNIVSLDKFFTVLTDGGDKFVGLIDGPYKGYEKAILEGYNQDYIYITLINSQQQIIKVFSHNVLQIEELEL